MLSKLSLAFGGLAIGIFGGGALLFYVHTDPSTETLDADLSNLRAGVSDAAEESSRYNEGLIKSLIELRRQTIQLTFDMVNQKRLSVIRRIDLRYTVLGRIVSPDQSKLNNINEDIEGTKARTQSDQRNADALSGGLVKSLAMATVATDRLSLAQLYLAFYAQKYETGLPATKMPSHGVDVAPGSPVAPGKPANDKDAL